MFDFNILDAVAFFIFLLCLFIGIRKGFLQMTFGFFSLMISVYAARVLYLPVSLFVRESTGLYEVLKGRIISAMGLSYIIEGYIDQGEEIILSRLPLPGVLIDTLAENNIPAVRQALQALTIEDYIGSFLALMGLNIISAAIVFILIMLMMYLAGSVIRLIVKLPVIRTFDKAGGAIAGALIGATAVWIIVTVYLSLFAWVSPPGDVFGTSLLVQFLYERGLLLRGITDIV